MTAIPTAEISSTPSQGCVVHCRSHRWLMEEVEPAEHPEGDTVVRLACLDDDANGQRLEVHGAIAGRGELPWYHRRPNAVCDGVLAWLPAFNAERHTTEMVAKWVQLQGVNQAPNARASSGTSQRGRPSKKPRAGSNQICIFL